MQHDAEDTSLMIIESDQGTDTFVQHSFGQTAHARLLSLRCRDASTQALPCQDYARVVSNREGSSICFCVCDGVSNSYKGNFAAQYLAECLVDWLQKLAVFPRKSSKLLKILRPRLNEWASEAQSALLCFDIPSELPALVREVLEELRSTYGSETVFLCGRIDSVERPRLRSQSHCVRALFCWMGNVTARLFITGDQHIDMGDKGNDFNRWSTVRGRHGNIQIKVFTFDTIGRLIVHTDGLDSIGGELADLSDVELQIRAQQLLALPTNDDMTVLDLQWLKTSFQKADKS